MPQQKHLELRDILPSGWELRPTGTATRLIAPSVEDAKDLVRGAINSLKQSAERMGAELHVLAAGSDRPLKVIKASGQQQSRDPEPVPQLSSYAPSSISVGAGYEEILDFIKGKKSENLIVTVTSMVDAKCLMVNDLQAADRGGGWTAADWIGLNFLKLWHDSFLPGRTNYYGQLVETVQRDKRINEYLYQIRRPSGALAEYASTYHLVDSFMGVPVRIAVSKPGDWRIVEDGHMEK